LVFQLSYEPVEVKRSCFTNKAFNHSISKKDKVVISLSSNSLGFTRKAAEAAPVEGDLFSFSFSLEVISVEKSSDKVSIADADIVVSGGRGLKGPENWHLIEDLASCFRSSYCLF